MDGASEQGQQVVGQFLAGDRALAGTLERLAEVAVEEIPGADAASITVIRDGKPYTPAFTDRSAIEVDETQYAEGDGPCLAAIRHSGIEEYQVGVDPRWPSVRSAAEANGVLGIFSVALQGEGNSAIGGLNLYSRTVPVLDAATRDQTVRLAVVIGIAVANAIRYDEAATLAAQLERALESRGVIEQAKGILMAAQRCSAEEAFDLLRRASQRENRKLREIAAQIVEHVQP